MKTIMIMLDTLRRDALPCYSDIENLPNFKRLSEHCSVFDEFYASSLPCMPARREMQTGFPNFLHRAWGPLEPYDISFVEVLKNNGIYTHLITDHQHYWEDGGATYHNRYNSYEFIRGQEGDLYRPACIVDEDLTKLDKYINAALGRQNMIRHDEANKKIIKEEADYPQVQCINSAIEFLNDHADVENWYLQLECFDPHEPFSVPDRFKDVIDPELKKHDFDWPVYANVRNIDELMKIDIWYKNYQALLLMLDEGIGKIIDAMDENDLWKDTTLILNTDHGFMFGEKEWSGKTVMPVYDELCHTPFLMHVPNNILSKQRYSSICQTYDIASTMYDLYKIEDAPKTFGRSILKIVDGTINREYGYCGYYGGHLNVFSSEYCYMRASVTSDNSPLKEYTLMPTRMRSLFKKEDFKNVRLVSGYDYFKDWKVLEVESDQYFYNPFVTGSLLFDKKLDPRQEKAIFNPEIEQRFALEALRFLNKVDAPSSQYKRLGLSENFDVYQDNKNRDRILKEKFGKIDYNIQPDNIKHSLVDIVNSNYKKIIDNLQDYQGILDIGDLLQISEKYYPGDDVVLNFIERKY